MKAPTFNVVRLDRGPKKGQVWVLPNCRKGGYRMRNGQLWSSPLLRAQSLLCGVSWEAAFFYAQGLLRGENGTHMTPYMKPGRAKCWKPVYAEDEEPTSYRRGRSDYREDFHADG